MILVISLWAAPALAQQCNTHDAVKTELGKKFGETVAGRGIAKGGKAMIELYVDPKDGSWSVTVTMVDGTTCFQFGGPHWESIPKVGPRS